MTENYKLLMRAIESGEMPRIRHAAIAALETDKTQKDAFFCHQMLDKLKNQSSFTTLPQNISKFLVAEDTKKTFIPERYFLSERESYLFNDIVKTDQASFILSQRKIRYTNSTLLHGKSGTGKTTFGRFVAFKLDIPFMYLSFATLISSFMGETGSRLKMVFDYVKDQRCVLMLDELDAIGVQRGKHNDVGETSRIAIALMQALDSLGNGIVLLGATNRLDIIDEAILRRFSRRHEVTELTDEESLQFAHAYLKSCGYASCFDNNTVEAIVKCSKNQSEIEKRLITCIIEVEIQNLDNLKENLKKETKSNSLRKE